MSVVLSVIIPAYNCAETLKDLFESLNRSSFKAFQVIVVDDGSTDQTVEIAKSFYASVLQQKNQGPGSARNKGAQVAEGEYILFLDSDTAVFPDTLTEVMSALNEEENDVVLGVYDKEALNKGFFPTYYALLKHYAQSSERISHYNVFAAHCAALKRSLFLESGGFYHFPKGVDIENEELGRKLHRLGANIVFEPKIRIRHHFAGFKKLIYIFVKRTYWWMRVFLHSKEFEKSLTTKSFGLGTLAGPFGLVCCLIASLTPYHNLSPIFLITGLFLLGYFIFSYLGFLKLCFRERGFWFGVKSIFSCFMFSFMISYGAIWGFAAAIFTRLVKGKEKELPGDFFQSYYSEEKVK